jgi:glycosyltransferase involved in cell wall biosynthesis
MRIAVFDHFVEPTNPIGGCHRRLIDGLAGEHEFTVFAVRFDNPDPDRIDWVRVPAPQRPLALLFVGYHLLAPVCYGLHRLRRQTRFDLVQTVESKLAFGDLAYSHFCHRAFLRGPGSPEPRAGLRSLLRWLDHRLHALVEPLVYRRVRSVVVPSAGLARELVAEFPRLEGRVTVIANPVDLSPDPRGDDGRRAVRARLGISDEHVVFVFVALGHFERKGLPLLLEALREPLQDDDRARVLVVGGPPDLVRDYRGKADGMGVGDRVQFVGMQPDVRPFLAASDVFVLPSAYETFSLVALEAAAAGLPLLVTRLHGVEDYVHDGRNGFVVDRAPAALAEGIAKFLTMTPGERQTLGEAARQEASRYGVPAFLDGWRAAYVALDGRTG